MTPYNKSLVTLFIIPLMAFTLLAQVIIKRNSRDGKLKGQPFVLQEVGAVIVATDGTLTIEHVMPHDNRPKAYADIDLREGDKILMANAKNIKSTKDLEELYNSVAVGSELKLGVKRNEEMFIVTLAKADQSHLPKMRIKLGGGGNDVEALPALGIMLKTENGKVIVADKLPNESAALSKSDVIEKDELTEMNGKRVTSLKTLIDAYDSLPVGSTVEWKLKRVDKSITVSFKKPQPKGMMFRHESKK